MGAAAYVGRVGGLAVALGIGTAVLTGYGVASADADSDSGTSSAEAAHATDTTATDTTAKDTTAKDPLATDARATDALAEEAPGDSPGPAPAERSVTAPAPARVSASGGANTRVGAPDPAKDEPKVDSRLTAVKEPSEAESVVTESVVAESESDVVANAPKSTGKDPVVPVEPAVSMLLASATRRESSTAAAGYYPPATVVENVITGTVPADAPPSFYTVTSNPINGGKVTFEGTTGNYAFLPDATQLTYDGYDQFKILVSQKSALVQLLEQVPLLKDFVKPIVVRLQQIPVVGTLLSPIIGSAKEYTIDVHVDDYLSAGPIAFTTKVESFDGVMISVNWFPKIGLDADPADAADDDAPTILNGPSLATAGYTDPTQATTVFGLVPGLAMLRENYNVVTWDPRGEFASGGRLHLDSEKFEAMDVSEIIDWVTKQAGTAFEGETDDPLIGMVGGSYGGGIQLTSAGIDDRIDAISPGIAWNDLTHTLYPNDAFKTSWASLLLLSLVASGSRLDPEIYYGIATGALFGFLTQGQQDFLSGNSPDTVADEIKIPTLFLQGTVDTLFPLRQAMANAEAIDENGVPVPMKMIWYCGGHGQCLDPVDLNQQTTYTTNEILKWMDTYVMNKAAAPSGDVDDPEKFTWVDQDGNWWASAELPIDDDFYGDVYPVPGNASGLLPIVPVFGGSGPDWAAKFPVSLVNGAKVEHGALNLFVPNPTPGVATYYVGAPQVTLEYSGLGTSRSVYAQLVDNNTGRVLGNIVSPIPVILDGTKRSVTVDMEAIAYTMSPPDPNDPNSQPDSLTLQVFDSATSFENFTAFGIVNVTSVGLTLPTAVNVTQLEMANS